MSNNNSVFDEIISSSILSYIPPREWGISKPFLLSSTFHQVCQSQEFSKQYLINLFKLSSEQIEQLELACSLFHNHHSEIHQKPKKKRKIRDEKVQLIKNIPQNMKQVLWTYFNMTFKIDTELIKREMIEKLEKHRKGSFDPSCLEDVQQSLKVLQMESYLLKSFNYFTSEEPQRIMTRTRDFIISEKVLLKIFGNVKDLFLIDIDEIGSSHSVMSICLFTSFGYPLFLRSEYSSSRQGSIKKMLDIFGEHVFSHQLSHGDAIDRFDKEKLQSLQELLFCKNVDNILVLESGIREKDLSDVKLSLLYEFLQCCFGTNGTMFRSFSLGWVPFVGKMRRVVREVGSTDFGSSSDDDDDEEDTSSEELDSDGELGVEEVDTD